jgi:hypothetical protein
MEGSSAASHGAGARMNRFDKRAMIEFIPEHIPETSRRSMLLPAAETMADAAGVARQVEMG